MSELQKVRVDRWLWTVRVFKSRSLSTKMCKSGKVKLGERTLKPSHLVVVGDELYVHKNGFNLHFKVDGLLKSRVSAILAAECYTDLTPADELNKYKNWFVGKGSAERREKGSGRPTKKERRTIDEFKDEQWWEFIDVEED